MHRFGARRATAALTLVLLLLGPSPSSWATPGEGDASFGTAGFVRHDLETGIDRGADVVAMPDGRLVVLSTAVGPGGSWGGESSFVYVVTRLLPTGAPDPTFGTGGKAEVDLGSYGQVRNDYPTGLGVAADGSVVITALHVGFDSRIVVRATRLLPDGRADAEWADHPSGGRELTIEGTDAQHWISWPEVVRLATGEVVVTFTWTAPTGVLQRSVLRLDPTLELDPRFGGGDGHAPMPVPSGAAPAVDASGRLVDADLSQEWNSPAPAVTTLRVARSLADGSPDATFGGDGVVDLDVSGRLDVDDPFLDVDISGATILITTTEGLVRLGASGAVDTTFGVGGFVDLPSYPRARAEVVAGGVTVVRQVHAARCVEVWRLDASGAPVVGFGTGGRAEVCARGGHNELAATVAAGGDLHLLTSSTAVDGRDPTATLAAVGDDGGLEPAFGVDGAVDLRYSTRGDDRAVALRLLPDGRMRVAIESPRGVGVLGLTASGARDPSYGVDGAALTTRGPASLTNMALQADGRVVVAGGGGLLRFDTAGRLDPTFGDGGVVLVDGVVLDLLQLVDGRLLVATEDRDQLLALHADGSADTSFAMVQSWAAGGPKGLARRGTGFLLVAGDGTTATIRGHRPDGTPDPSYAGGTATTLGIGFGQMERALVTVNGAGRAYVANSHDVVEVAISGQGAAPIGLENLGDERRYLGENPSDCGICAIAVDGSGRLLLARGSYHGIWLERVLTNGSRDASFGDKGLRIMRPEGTAVGVADIGLDTQGRILAAATTVGAWRPASDVVVARLDPRQPTDLPTVTVSDVTYDEDTSYPSVTVHLDRRSTVSVVVTLQLENAGALEAEDWQQLQMPAVIPAGSLYGRTSLQLNNSPWIEGDETITVRVVEAHQALGEGGTGTVTVLDDDAVSDTRAGDGFVSIGLGPTIRDAGVLADPDPRTYNDDELVVGYVVVLQQAGVPLRTRVVPVDTPRISIDGLRNGVPASVFVLPFSKDGPGTLGSPTTVTPTKDGGARQVPPAPAHLYVEPGVGYLSATWMPPPDEGGAPLVGYFVVAQTPTGVVAAVEAVAGDVRHVSLRGLSAHVPYTVTVVSMSGAGIGGGRSVVGTPKAIGSDPAGPWPPSQPTYALATRQGGAASVLWGPPNLDYGAPVDSYHVIVVQRGQLRSWQAFGADGRTASIGGLQTGPAEVYVFPHNAAGYGQPQVSVI